MQVLTASCNAGSHTEVGEIVYYPPRDGPTLWEIGIPDRSAAEFYVPDPDPKYVNKLFINHPDRLALVLYSSEIYLSWVISFYLQKIICSILSFAT